MCETLRVVSDWVANAAARNEHDVMEYDVVFVSKKSRHSTPIGERMQRNDEFPNSKRIHLQHAKTG